MLTGQLFLVIDSVDKLCRRVALLQPSTDSRSLLSTCLFSRAVGVLSRAANSIDFCIEFKFEFSLFYEFDIFIFASSSPVEFIKFFRVQKIK